MYHAANFIIKQFNFCYDFYFSLFTLLYPFLVFIIVAAETVSTNAASLLTITGKTQMAKVAKDAAATSQKRSRRKKKKTPGKSGIYFNYPPLVS